MFAASCSMWTLLEVSYHSEVLMRRMLGFHRQPMDKKDLTTSVAVSISCPPILKWLTGSVMCSMLCVS